MTTVRPAQPGAQATDGGLSSPGGREIVSRRRRVGRRRPLLTGGIMVLPASLILLVFWVIPLVLVIGFSFFHWTDGTQPRFDGVGEYRIVLSSHLFWQSVVITLIFAAGTVVVGTLISLGLALALHAGLRAVRMFRALFFLPYVTPIVATSTVWLWIYQPGVGILDRMLASVGLPGTIAWVSYPKLALISLMIYTIWFSFGFTTLLFMAGLTEIPKETVEATHLDGASTWQRIRWVILPLLAPTTLFVVVVNTINAFQAFTQIYALTRGGPLNGTTTLTYLIYQLSFQYFHFGQASSAATLFFLLVGLLVLIQFRVARRTGSYRL